MNRTIVETVLWVWVALLCCGCDASSDGGEWDVGGGEDSGSSRPDSATSAEVGPALDSVAQDTAVHVPEPYACESGSAQDEVDWLHGSRSQNWTGTLARAAADGIWVGGFPDRDTTVRMDEDGSALDRLSASGVEGLRERPNGGLVVMRKQDDETAVVRWLADDGTADGEARIEPGGKLQLFDVAVGPDGATYVAGETEGAFPGHSSGADTDGFVIAYSSPGTRDWMHVRATDGSDQFRSVSSDSDGAVYAVGSTRTDRSSHAFFAKFDGSSEPAWLEAIDATNSVRANAVAVDSNDSIYIAGSASGELWGQPSTEMSRDAFVAGYDAAGSRKWVTLIGGSLSDEVHDLAADSDRDLVYAAGTFGVATGGGEMTFVSLDTSGSVLREITPGPDEQASVGLEILEDESNIYVSARSNGRLCEEMIDQGWWIFGRLDSSTLR